MKNKLLSLLFFSMLMSVTVFAADDAQTENLSSDAVETRIVTIEVNSAETSSEAVSDAVDSDEASDGSETIEILETRYIDESGLSLWYNTENLKPAEYGGQLCFIPVAEEEALKSPVVLLVVSNEPGETPSPLNEVTASYPAENVSEIEEITLESGIVIQSVEVTDGDRFNQFSIVAYEDVSANVTAMMPSADAALYQAEFDRLIESITFETE